MADAPKYPDFSQPSIMNPKYGPAVAKMLGPLIRELQRQQQFAGAFGVSPRQAIKPTPEETQRMLNVGLAFGGADITKEQRAQWEKENAEYRAASRWKEGSTLKGFEPGTRVTVRPPPEDIKRFRDVGAEPGSDQGVIVTPGTPEAGRPGHKEYPLASQSIAGVDQTLTDQPPTPDHVAVRNNNAPWWFWRHRDRLEVLPPKDKFNIGDRVEFRWGEKETPIWEGVVAEPPKGYERQSWMSPDHLWIDVDQQVPEGMVAAKNEKIYPSGTWGSWFHPENLHKKVKK